MKLLWRIILTTDLAKYPKGLPSHLRARGDRNIRIWKSREELKEMVSFKRAKQ
jgi:hypothetical protein